MKRADARGKRMTREGLMVDSQLVAYEWQIVRLWKERERLREENAQLRAALSALVTDRDSELPAGVADYDGHQYCLYCDDDTYVGDFRDVGHTPDCPIVAGREALKGK